MSKYRKTSRCKVRSVHADWFYDAVEAIDDAGIAVSGVIVDGVNDIPTGIVDFLEVSVKMVRKTSRCKVRTEVKEGSYRYANNPTNKKSRRDFKLDIGLKLRKNENAESFL
jgi:hypothetical protein